MKQKGRNRGSNKKRIELFINVVNKREILTKKSKQNELKIKQTYLIKAWYPKYTEKYENSTTRKQTT